MRPAAASSFDVLPATGTAFAPGLLRAHRLFESSDLDDARERISRVMQPHRLQALERPRGGCSHMDFVRVGGIGLGTIRFGETTRVDVSHVEDYHLLMFCLQGHAEVQADDRPLQADGRRGMVCAPGSRFVADLSPDCEQFVLRLDRRMLESHTGRPLRFDSALDLERPALQAWRAQLHLLLSSQALMQAVQASPIVAAEMERLLVHLLLAGQPWTDDVPLRIAARPASAGASQAACVRRAVAHMEAHAAEALRLADIAAAAGVSVRTLLDAFHRVRDESPMQTLRDLRLERARQRLRAGEDGITVAAVALDCGFAHLSRFAQAYRARFGESPSDTLRAAG